MSIENRRDYPTELTRSPRRRRLHRYAKAIFDRVQAGYPCAKTDLMDSLMMISCIDPEIAEEVVDLMESLGHISRVDALYFIGD